MRTKFTGVGTALVTPFTKSGELDEKAVRRLGRRQIDAGIHFLVPCGTTGENPTLEPAERIRIVEILVDEAKGQVPVLAGRRRLQHERSHASGRGDAQGRRGRPAVGHALLQQADAGRPLPALPRHRRRTPLPIVVYNVPGRTGVNIDVATLVRLAAIPNIIGVKEASGNITQMCEVCRAVPSGLHRAVGRRCADAAVDGRGRPRRHLGRVERDSRKRWCRWSKRPSATTSPRRAPFTRASCR